MQALRTAPSFQRDNGNSPGVREKPMSYAESTVWLAPLARSQCGAATMVEAATGTVSGGAETYMGLICTG